MFYLPIIGSSVVLACQTKLLVVFLSMKSLYDLQIATDFDCLVGL